MEQNQNYIKRDKIIFGKPIQWGTVGDESLYFETLSVKQLKELLDHSLINVLSAHNTSPTVGEYYEFMKIYPNVLAHGYVESGKEECPKIVIEGLACNNNITDVLKADFEKNFKNADEFISNKEELYCWYD